MEILFYLSCIVATISLTISKAEVFEGFREWLEWWKPVHAMVSCPYCLSHWVGAMVVMVVDPTVIFTRWYWVDLILIVFLVVSWGAVIMGIIYKFLSWIELEG